MSPSLNAVAAECLKRLARQYGGPEATTETIDELCRLAPAVTLAVGDVVFREGDAADRALFVVEGHLRATLAGRTVGESSAGDVVGEAVFIDGGRRAATLTATEPTRCLTLTRDLFGPSQGNTAVLTLQVHLIRLLARRITETDDLLVRAWRDAAAGKSDLRQGLASAFTGWTS